MLGIKNSGKTQFVESLRRQSHALMIPTLGCTHYYFSEFFIKDPIDQEFFRFFREINYLSADGIIFVISLLDFHDRKDEVKLALIDALVNTGNKPLTIVINNRDKSDYDAVREQEVRLNVLNWWKVVTWMMNLNNRRYGILSCNVNVEADVMGCFDQIAKSI